ncbi:2-dehydropantoate 2-reductase [Rhizobium sp. BK251]|uniref:ketopantoate reductase family protein n=1 Tax=Rhizobium sp. BK251 TaxID=2512125 RepID=UPI001045DDE2|nr:2-dehydropantoate 2-reductase [Rhizobium sp. BK251]TCL74835.1 ketopantoate reductase [Rhizobium sp. BK251]
MSLSLAQPPREEERKDLRVCIAGAGAIGITLGARIALGGYPVSMLARGKSLSAIKERGLRLVDMTGDHSPRVIAGEPADLPEADVIFLCPKSQDLPALAEASQRIIGPRTLIVPVVNGIPWWYFDGINTRFYGRDVKAVDPEGRLKQLLPSDRVIGAVTTITAERVAPGFACSVNPLRFVLGEIDHSISDRVEQLGAMLNASGITTRVTDKIRDSLWTKVIANLVSNPLSVVSGAVLRDIGGHPSLSQVTRALVNEVLPVAAAYGARVELDPEALLELPAGLGDIRTSMLQDFEKHMPLETAAICDAVIELAELRGLQMPMTKAIGILANYRSAQSREARPQPIFS